MPFLIGLTGTIASGKSTAADFFKQQGMTVISADEIARTLTQKNTPVLKQIVKHFGDFILNSDGTLSRGTLRAHITKNPKDKIWLERQLHPKIRKAIEAQIGSIRSPYGIIEIPLLITREPFPYLNHVLLIDIERQTQIQRLMVRDNCTKQAAEAMINMQPDETQRRAIADDIIQNNKDYATFEKELLKRHQHYLQEACKTTTR